MSSSECHHHHPDYQPTKTSNLFPSLASLLAISPHCVWGFSTSSSECHYHPDYQPTKTSNLFPSLASLLAISPHCVWGFSTSSSECQHHHPDYQPTETSNLFPLLAMLVQSVASLIVARANLNVIISSLVWLLQILHTPWSGNNLQKNLSTCYLFSLLES